MSNGAIKQKESESIRPDPPPANKSAGNTATRLSIQNSVDALKMDIDRLILDFVNTHGCRCDIDLQWIDSTSASSARREFIPVVNVSAIVESNAW